MKQQQQVQPQQPGSELLAMDMVRATAFFQVGSYIAEKLPGDTAYLRVSGAFTAELSWFGIAYHELTDTVEQLAAAGPAKIVIELTSPGGSVAGLHAAIAKLQAVAKRVPTYIWVPSYATSAAYAIATAVGSVGKTFLAHPHALIGSVDVVYQRLDLSKYDAERGVQYSFFSVGERKLYGTPHLAMTEKERAYYTELVQKESRAFVDEVASYGYGSAEFWMQQQGAAVPVQPGLVDKIVSTWQEGAMEMEEKSNALTGVGAAAPKQQPEAKAAEPVSGSANTSTSVSDQRVAALVAEVEKLRAALAEQKATSVVQEAQRMGRLPEGEAVTTAFVAVVMKAGSDFLQLLPRKETVAASKQQQEVVALPKAEKPPVPGERISLDDWSL